MMIHINNPTLVLRRGKKNVVPWLSVRLLDSGILTPG